MVTTAWLQFLRSTLSRQPCERLLASPQRHLLHEAPVTLLGMSRRQSLRPSVRLSLYVRLSCWHNVDAIARWRCEAP